MVYKGGTQRIKTVQNMYGKGGLGVFKAELRGAEVDPRFEICRDANAVLQKTNTLLFFVRSL